jgi:hypothetical protein
MADRASLVVRQQPACADGDFGIDRMNMVAEAWADHRDRLAVIRDEGDLAPGCGSGQRRELSLGLADADRPHCVFSTTGSQTI